MDIGKYKYDQQKKASKAKKNQKKVELKEIKLKHVTEVQDYTFKIKNAKHLCTIEYYSNVNMIIKKFLKT